MQNISIYDFLQMGLTEAQLIALRDSILNGNLTQTLTGGKVITSVNAPGLTTNFQVFATPIEILKSITYALQMMNPSVHGIPPMNTTIGYMR